MGCVHTWRLQSLRSYRHCLALAHISPIKFEPEQKEIARCLRSSSAACFEKISRPHQYQLSKVRTSTKPMAKSERFLADRDAPLCRLEVAKAFKLLRCVAS